MTRRTLLGASSASVTKSSQTSISKNRYPESWPDPEPYGLADDRKALWPRDDNSFVLDLELRPRDEELGRVWIRDTYVNCYEVDGEPLYVATGTTRVTGLSRAAPYNDGIFIWTAPDLKGPWKLADTSTIRPDAEKGKVWSQEFTAENTAERTVVADWQEYWTDTTYGKRAQVWAPEVHYFRGTWYIVACMGDHAQKVGSFLLISEGGVEGPYRLAKGNQDKPFGDLAPDGPSMAAADAYYHIDGSMFTEGDDAWLVLHNHYYAKFTDDMEDIEPVADLPTFDQEKYDPEPYLEGAYVFKYKKKYFLVQSADDRTSIDADGSPRFAYQGSTGTQYQYDAVAAVADAFEGPYSQRYTFGVGTGHNNLFLDHHGQPWSTYFLNPLYGYWSNSARVADAAAAGVVRLERTGPQGNRLSVKRPND